MQRLSGLDATFLYMETASNLMHVASVAVIDPSTVPGGYSFDKVRALVENRLPLLPPFRRRLLEIPFQLHHPLWIEDPDFDLDYHLRRAALPSPGAEQQLSELALRQTTDAEDISHVIKAAMQITDTCLRFRAPPAPSETSVTALILIGPLQDDVVSMSV